MGFFGSLWDGITGAVGAIPVVGGIAQGVLEGIGGGQGGAVNNTPYVNQPYTPPQPVIISAPAPIVIPTTSKVDNTLLYVGLGLVAVVIVLVITGVIK